MHNRERRLISRQPFDCAFAQTGTDGTPTIQHIHVAGGIHRHIAGCLTDFCRPVHLGRRQHFRGRATLIETEHQPHAGTATDISRAVNIAILICDRRGRHIRQAILMRHDAVRQRVCRVATAINGHFPDQPFGQTMQLAVAAQMHAANRL